MPLGKTKRMPPIVTPTAAPQWMTTWADLMTLLLSFFVMRFAAMSVDHHKLEETLQHFRRSNRQTTAAPSTHCAARPDTVKEFQAILAERLGLPPLAGWPAKEATGKQGITLRLNDHGAVLILHHGLFSTGSAELTFQGQELVGTIGRAVHARNAELELRAKCADFSSGAALEAPGLLTPWDLGAARSAALIRELMNAGVNPTALLVSFNPRKDPNNVFYFPSHTEIVFRVE